jgi:hypothetical protein
MLRELQLKYQLAQSKLENKILIQEVADIVATKLWEKYVQEEPVHPFATDIGEDRLLNLNLYHIMRLKDMKIARIKIPDVLKLPEFKYYPKICSVRLEKEVLERPEFKEFLNLKQVYYKIKYWIKNESGKKHREYKKLSYFEKIGRLEKEDDWSQLNILVLDNYFGYFFTQNVLTGNVEIV